MYYKIKGKVKNLDGGSLHRRVMVFERENFAKIAETYSSSIDGTYEMSVATDDPVLVMAVPDSGDDANARVYDLVVPKHDPIVVPTGIGIAGQPGFGVGVAAVIPTGFTPMEGYSDPYHDNYGNYRVESDGSIMVWIPAFYYKWGTGSNGVTLNDVSIKDLADYIDPDAASADGYAIHRAFIDGGEIKSGVFVDKYGNSKNPTLNVPSSLKYGNVLHTAASPAGASMSTLGLPNAYYSCIDASKLRGTGFFCMSVFIWAAIAMLSHAHGIASASTQYCGWWGATHNYPKGNDNSGNSTTDSSSMRFYGTTISGYTTILSGSAWPVSKSTHNGQACGIAEVCGNVWNVVPGLNFNGTNFMVLKESFSMKDATSGTSAVTDMWSNTPYDVLSTTLSDFSTSAGWVYRTNASQVYAGDTDRTSIGYKQTCMGIPMPGNVSATNPNYMGGGIYKSMTNQLCPIAFGAWYDALIAGVGALALYDSRANSSCGVGLRSAFYV